MSAPSPAGSANQRVFFAIWPDVATRAALAELAIDVAATAHGRAAALERLHLTLAFIGEVDIARVPQLMAIGAETAAQAIPCSLTLHRLGYFRDAGVAWIGTDRIPDALLALANDLQSRLASAGFPVDTRPYQPHLTLARRCRNRPVGFAPPTLAWDVRAMTLHASKLGREGPSYTELGRWRLGG